LKRHLGLARAYSHTTVIELLYRAVLREMPKSFDLMTFDAREGVENFDQGFAGVEA
jgi:hypothetical protein